MLLDRSEHRGGSEANAWKVILKDLVNLYLAMILIEPIPKCLRNSSSKAMDQALVLVFEVRYLHLLVCHGL